MLLHVPVPEETVLQNTSEITGGRSQWLLTYSGNIFYCNEVFFGQEPFQSWVLLQYVLCFVSVCKKFNLSWACYNFPLAETKQSWW